MRAPDWAGLGLRGNPFENVVPGERLDWVDLPSAVLEALRRRPVRLELQGPKGAGKSTLLRAIAAQLPAAHYQYLGPTDRLTPLPATGIASFLLDEADRAERKMLRNVIADATWRGLSVVLGTHVPLTHLFEGTWASVQLEREPALAWVQRRVEAARAGREVPPPDFVAAALRLHPLCGGVNYAIQRTLYELAEDLARGAEWSPALERRAMEVAAADPGQD